MSRQIPKQPERIGMTAAMTITGVPQIALQRLAERGEIPGASKPYTQWTFDEAQLRTYFNMSSPASATVHHLNNLGPRGLNRERAAQHLKLSIEDFDRSLKMALIPQPLRIDGRDVWPIQNLKLSKRPRRENRKQHAGVYVLGFDNYIKIGMSADVIQRINEIQTWLPAKVFVHCIFVGDGRETEKMLHDRFSRYRLRGEWFKHEGALADWIKEQQG
jgi:hypothetical protein